MTADRVSERQNANAMLRKIHARKIGNKRSRHVTYMSVASRNTIRSSLDCDKTIATEGWRWEEGTTAVSLIRPKGCKNFV